MAIRKIKDGIHWVGALDWERKLFDQLIPLPDGTSYNSYYIEGSEKSALIDTVDKRKTDELLRHLSMVGAERIDYIIANHAEQDHSDTIPTMIELHPEALVVTNDKCKAFLKELHTLPEEKFLTKKDGETLSLGDRTLEFIMAPWVHWPETMLTYLQEDRILFPCDLFGSHLASSELYATDEALVYPSAKRYYAQIMMPYRSTIKKHMKKLEDKKIELIAPSHGPVYNRPDFILDAYNEWLSDEVSNEVVIPYLSMHGSTEKMVNYFVDKLIEHDIVVKPFHLVSGDLGELAMAIVDAATIVLATPTVLAGPHPAAVCSAYLINALRPRTRFISVIGSYGWGGKTADILTDMLRTLEAEVLEPVIIKGRPDEKDYSRLEALVDTIVARHRETRNISS